MIGYLAVFELLAFDSFITNNDTETCLKSYKKLSEELHKAVFPLSEAKQRIEKRLHFAAYDKYFVIWTEDDSPRAFHEVISKSQVMIALSLAEGFPLRGCINCAEVPDFRRYIDHVLTAKTLLSLSKGFRKTIEVLEVNPMMGSFISVHALVSFEESRTKKTATISDFVKLKLLVEVPIEGIEQKPLAVNWLVESNFNPPIEQLVFIFQKHNKDITEDIVKIIENTKYFISIVQAPRLN